MSIKTTDETKYLLSTQARDEFGLSRDLMTKLLKTGQLSYETDPLDSRTKYIKRSDLIAILGRSEKYKRQQAEKCQQRPRRSAHSVLPKVSATSQKEMTFKLHLSDKVVLNFLTKSCALTGTDQTPLIGYKTIAERCGIAKRTAQMCCDRLINAGKIERRGHDSSHLDRTKRGMVYRVLKA